MVYERCAYVSESASVLRTERKLFVIFAKNRSMSKVRNLLHIVFNTKSRKMTIANDYREDVYRFIWKLCKEMNCYLLQVNGIPNHIHILVSLSPSISVADFVKKVKQQTSSWMKECGSFPDFEGWGREYGAFSVSESAKFDVIEYIKGQQVHHRKVTFENEYKDLCSNSGLSFTSFDLT